MPLIQNFSVPAGDAAEINFDVGPDTEGVSLIGSDIVWQVFEQQHGVRVADSLPVITKVLDDGLQITDPDALKFQVVLTREDTLSLLRNYFHEARVMPEGEVDPVTVVQGIMTVTGTEIRE